MKVRCIDDTNITHLYTGLIKCGQVYDAEPMMGMGTDGGYYMIDKVPWMKSRFVVVDVVSPAAITIKPPSHTSTDMEEERCWNALRPYIAADECKCGIKRVMCDYHRS